MNFNDNLIYLDKEDSFYKVSERIKEYKRLHKNHNIVSLGIGDVSFPLCNHVALMMKKAIDIETSDNFVGYGNYYGLFELREKIRENEYQMFSVDEIYVSHGTKSDCGDILEILDNNSLIGIPNPTYPIYKNSCVSLSKNIELIDCDINFMPIVPNKHFDAVYLCSPNNPVGISYSYDELKKWVDYANKENCLILFDNVYYKFINEGIKSIYEIEGAKKCAIEFRSFSKHVSFTGIRCSYYIIPKELSTNINKYWKLRTINRFNGASYIAQMGALSSFDKEAQIELNRNIKSYKDNSIFLRESFLDMKYEVIGGIDAPYLWIKCKNNMTGWEVFEEFLNKLEVIVIPGSIFGDKGLNYFRVSALGKREVLKESIKRIRNYEQKNK